MPIDQMVITFRLTSLNENVLKSEEISQYFSGVYIQSTTSADGVTKIENIYNAVPCTDV